MFWESLLPVDQNKNAAEVPETFLVSFVFDKQYVIGTNLCLKEPIWL